MRKKKKKKKATKQLVVNIKNREPGGMMDSYTNQPTNQTNQPTTKHPIRRSSI